MWNFGIPYKLKHWIDVITQPGLTFRFDPAQGYLPLLKDRPTVVIIAVAAIAALVAFQKWEEWVNAALAAWLIVSPYILGFSALASALWNQIVVGVLVGILAIWAAVATSDRGVTAKS
jgi:hypothetical protein